MKEQPEWKTYTGTTPCPEDFDLFWEKRLKEADNIELKYEIKEADYPEYKTCSFKELRFKGIGKSEIYAKYILPKTEAKIPLILQFHGYPGASRSFLEQASFVGMGFGIIAMDCPGQGGYSYEFEGYNGTTMGGHIVAGLDGEPENMYYVKLFQNIRILCRIVKELPEIDLSRVYVNGGSQGGAQGIACAALSPELISKAAILYPFLSDYEKVFEMGKDEIAYEGLRYYSRWFDADGSRSKEIFNKLGYIDMKNFAHMVQCEVLFGTGGIDEICPPPTQYAVYNNLKCKKQHLFYPDFGHEEIQAFDDLLLSYF